MDVRIAQRALFNRFVFLGSSRAMHNNTLCGLVKGGEDNDDEEDEVEGVVTEKNITVQCQAGQQEWVKYPGFTYIFLEAVQDEEEEGSGGRRNREDV